MRRIATALLLFTAAPAFAEDAKVDVRITGLHYESTTTKKEPDGGTSTTEKKTGLVTSTPDIDFTVQKDQFVVFYKPDLTKAPVYNGVLGLGYKAMPDLEVGLQLDIGRAKVTEEDATVETNNATYAIYAKYWLWLAEGSGLKFTPKIAITNNKETEDNPYKTPAVDSETTTKGNSYGLSVTYIAVLAENLSYEGVIGYTTGKYKIDNGAESDHTVNKLEIIPLSFRVKI